MGKSIAVAIALLCLNHAASAQDMNTDKPAAVSRSSAHEVLNSGVAHLAVKAALQPSAEPSQQELLAVIMLMSLRQGART